MNIRAMMVAGLAASTLFASSAMAQQVTNTSLVNANGQAGVGGTATTTTNANGTVTTVTGPGGDPNRLYLPPAPGKWQQSAVGGGGSVGITNTYSEDSNGAAFFSGTGPDSKGDLEYRFAQSVALSSLTSMSFDFFRDGNVSTYEPVMRLAITKNGNYAGYLVFEYHYQNQTNGPGDVWTNQAATLDSGIFWATSSSVGHDHAGAGGELTLAQWLANPGNANLQVTGVEVGFGSGWPTAFAGAVDHVKYNFTDGPSADWDFAVAGAVPEPASWALMLGGFGMIGGAMRARRRTTVVA